MLIEVLIFFIFKIINMFLTFRLQCFNFHDEVFLYPLQHILYPRQHILYPIQHILYPLQHILENKFRWNYWIYLYTYFLEYKTAASASIHYI